MKILNISLDKNILDKNSAVSERLVEYGSLVDKYTVLVLAGVNKEFNLSDKVKVIAVKKTNKIFSLLKLKKAAKKLLSENNFDIITAQDVYFVGWLAAMLAKKFKIGLEIQVHGFEKFKGIRKMLAKKVLKRADAVRVVSQRLKKKLITEFNISEGKITVIPIYTEHVTRNAQRVTRNDDKFIFLTISRLVPIKNIEMQIKAVQKLKSLKVKKDIELWVIGEGGERKKLEKLCYALRVTRYVKFFGWQKDVDKYYSQADAYLLTSNSEGWGLSVIEAAAHKLPIIMTNVGLAGEVIKDNESGIIIPVGDQKALEKAMIKIIEDKGLREKLGEGAHEAIKKLPTKEETYKLYLKSWQKAMKN